MIQVMVVPQHRWYDWIITKWDDFNIIIGYFEISYIWNCLSKFSDFHIIIDYLWDYKVIIYYILTLLVTSNHVRMGLTLIVTILKTVSNLKVKNGELMLTPVSCLFLTSTPDHNFRKNRKLFEERQGVSHWMVC